MRLLRKLGAIWGILGVTLLLGTAILRLAPHVQEAINLGMNSAQWLLLLLWSIYMLYTEGYRGFQKQFAPRVASRALHLLNHGRIIDIILAPFFCAGYFQTTKKRLIIAWTATTLIILLIISVRHLSQPWRGVLDSGVVLGLSYGIVCLYISVFRTFKSRKYIVNPEVA